MGRVIAPLDAGSKSGDYSLLVVHYEAPEAVETLLGESMTWSRPPADIIVLDNSGDFLAPAEYGDRVRVVSLPNPGYGAAANVGIDLVAAEQKYALLVTQDFRCETDCVEQLIAEANAEPEAGAVAPLLLEASEPDNVFSAGGALSRNGRMTHVGNGDQLLQWGDGVTREAVWADGACLLLRMAAAKQTGGFDESFFLYVEDVDYAIRLRQHGWHLRIAPKAIASQQPGNFLLYLKYRNSVFFSRKHREILKPWPWWILAALDVLRAHRRERLTSVRWIFAGIYDGYRRRMGTPRPGAKASPPSRGRHALESSVRTSLSRLRAKRSAQPSGSNPE